MKKNKKKLLSIISSLFGISALCGLFSLCVFTNGSKGVEPVSAVSTTIDTVTVPDGDYVVDFNTNVNGSYEYTRTVDYLLDYRIDLLQEIESDTVKYYFRITFNDFSIRGYDVYQDIASYWSVTCQFGLLGNQFILYSDYLPSDYSGQFDLVLFRSGIYLTSSSNSAAYLWAEFGFLDVSTGTFVNGASNPMSMYDISSMVFSDNQIYQYMYNYPLSYNYNLDDLDDSYTVFRRFLFITTSDNYDLGYIEGYNNGFNDGYNSGFNIGSTNGYSSGYNAGMNYVIDDYENQLINSYNEGYASGSIAEGTASDIFNGILQVGLLPINMFLTMFDFNVLGINISSFVKALLTVCITIIVVKVVLGNSSSGGE